MFVEVTRAIVVLAPGLALLAAPVHAARFEPDSQIFHSAALLAGGLDQGEHYRVLPRVINRGLMNHYRIETDYGPMTAGSDRVLHRRLREVRALTRLSGMHEGKVVAQSAGRAVWRTAESIVDLARDPVGTAKGVRQGIRHLFRRAGRKLENAYDDVRGAVAEDDDEARVSDLPGKAMRAGARIARKGLGVSRAYRRLARELGVDPYTRNRILARELDRIAKHAAGGSLGSRLMMPRIPGLIGAVDDVSELVWQKDRLDLLLHNEQVLRGLAIPEALIKRFTENESYTATQQTALVASVAALDGVNNRWHLIDYAARASAPAHAEFYTAMAGLLSLYHSNRAPLRSIHATGSFVPVAFARDIRAVVAFPVDRFRWTANVAGMTAALNRSAARGVAHRELWVTGHLSDPGRRALAGHHWIPFNRALLRLGALPGG